MSKATARAAKKSGDRSVVRELTRAELAKLAGCRPGEWHCINKATDTHSCSNGVSE